ncbi:LOW QUALITY PROTEIN: thioredoxin domain-containing protein 3 homolog [Haliotis rubra]|uniref:LOW QUALITY PROTEIN: thioredoxin domain-containing protein 3 homolog n=1 Tax=Haliotis rubra TaxID=36100 RepID=UPI001EE5946D|nr:LOW QUALITY PROTEIN: thioredoxin domain-containing protein 3 homolog [Haliotis rubra]
MGAEEDKKKKAAKMARRKQEVQLQQEIETAEEWEEMIAKEGLWVVDVYQEWCGPCAAMVANFRRLKNELGDDLLHFAAAKADTVDSLEKYRGRCEPCFLFFAGGVLVAFVHGANSPVILRTIMEQLKAEHKVIDGNGERKEVKDPLISNLEEREKAQYDEEENEKEEEEDDDNVLDYRGERCNYGDTLTMSSQLEEEKKGFTVAIIKPDVVRDGKVEEILQQMEEAGIEILEKQERQLTEEEARTFYDHLKDEEYFNDLVEFMSSGPSCVLVLTKGQKGDTVIKEWRDLIGPTNVEEAKDKAPESLRAKYGSEKCMNALHGSDSPECAAREMAFFFPDMATPTIPAPGSQPQLQRTMALIRPDAFGKNKDEIMEKIKEAGFKVALQKEMTLTEDQAKEFYKEHTDKPYFDELIARMTSGPLMALGLAREDAVSEWRKVLGPTTNAKEEAPDSLRAQFSIDESSINQLHGSDSIETAEKEIQHFFPMEQTVAAIKPDAFSTKDEIIAKIHEAGFRIAARKETTITKEIAEEFYGEHKGKEYFDDLVGHMTSGPTMFMVLSREDAVSGWREVIGPTNPEQAQTEAPESLRAIYGKDILLNALHGSSDVNHAKSTIEQVFGHLEFKPDGNLEDEDSQTLQSEPTKDQDEPAVEETQAEANDVAPEFRQEGTEEESGETKQETSEDNAEGGTAQGEDGVKKEEEDEPPKPEGEEAAKPEGEEAAKPEGEEAAKPEGEEAQAQSEQTESEQPKDEGEAQAKGESGEEAQANQETTESQSKTDQEGVTEQKSEERPASEAKEEDKTDDSKGEDAKEGDVKDGENKAEDKAEEEQKGEDASKAAEESEKKEEEAKQEEDTKEEDAKKDDETKTEQKEETKSEEQQAST